jgi:hypothetical protein
MYPPKNVFIFAPKFNQPPDAANPSGGDATGAFQPGAQKFEAYCKKQGAAVKSILFNNQADGEQTVNEILHAMAGAPSQLDTVVYFGHGTKEHMVSAKIGPGHLPKFIAALNANCGFAPTIILYACSCGAPDGVAEKIATGMSGLLPTVYGHLSAGHAFTNPQVRAFPGGTRVAPEGLIKQWIKAIGDQKGDFWIRFPFMTDEEIKQELQSVKA